MITRDNINEVVAMIRNRDRNRIRYSDYEYVILELSVFNAGAMVHVRLTNSLRELNRLSSEGNCILNWDDPIFDAIKQGC